MKFCTQPFFLRKTFVGSVIVCSVFWGVFTSLALAQAGAEGDTGTQAKMAVSSANPGYIPDPFEGFNRKSFGFNKAFDRALGRPIAMSYRRGLPKDVRAGFHNFLQNLGSPAVFINDVLQLRPKYAQDTALRFGVNTTVGVLGFFDVASVWGVYPHKADLGQTFGRYGIESGPYFVWPLFGSSSLRDTVGTLGNILINPFNYIDFDGDTDVRLGLAVVEILDTRVALDRDIKDLENKATDPYASFKTIWTQNRAAFIRGDEALTTREVDALPDFSSDAMPPSLQTSRPLDQNPTLSGHP